MRIANLSHLGPFTVQPCLKLNFKRAGDVAQCDDPEFNPPYLKKQKRLDEWPVHFFKLGLKFLCKTLINVSDVIAP